MTLPALLMSVLIPTVPSGQVLGPRIVRSLFNTDPAEVRAAGIAPQLRAAGVTHLEMQIYHRPGPATVAEWEATEGANLDWCKANGWRLVGLGDCAFRNSYRQDEATVRYVAGRLRDSGIVDGVEMVDEVHPNPAEYQPADYLRWWREENGPPVAWPGLMPLKWETDALSDYSSRYWPAYLSADLSPKSIAHQMTAATAQVRKDRPFGLLTWCCDASYRGKQLVYAGVSAQSIVTQTALALALGASWLRMYSLDCREWQQARAAKTTGQLQTGSRPGDARWPGVVAAFTEIAKREPTLLRTAYVPTRRGQWVYGRRGEAPDSVVWGVNTQTASVKWWNLLELLRG